MALDAAVLAPLCVLLPLASGAFLASVRLGRTGVAWVSNLAILAAFACALGMLGVHANIVYGTWAVAGSLRVPLGVLVDPLSNIFTLIITGVGFLIHLYSVGYMAEDGDFQRYFSYLNFFVAAMLLLVLADSFPLLLVGWAGVGLASYLLIGFWYDRPLAVVAARKAFLINVVGDVAILVAILIMAAGYGRVGYAGVFRAGPLPGAAGVAIALLLLAGAAAKSAQLPLHTWLPDAMEGPTPVSALIHAATMVTAGAYLLVRAHVLFVPAEEVAAIVGGASCLMAATLAVCQTDFKRLLAFSTMSQVGYMFLGAAVGAAGAAVSHVVTHAFFKALLFLCAGAVMHALGDEKDLRRMGGLARRMPITNWTFLAAALAIAGAPGLSGFWSKDAVLEALLATGHPWLWVVGVLAAGLTALYIFRMYYLTFHGTEQGPAHAHGDPGPVMVVPMVILAFLAVFGGVAAVTVQGVLGGGPVLSPLSVTSGITLLVALAGWLVAHRLYARRGIEGDAWLSGRLGAVLRAEYGIEAVYRTLIQRPAWALGTWAAGWIEKGFLGFGPALGTAMSDLGEGLTAWQSGQVRRYALSLMVGAALVVLYAVWR